MKKAEIKKQLQKLGIKSNNEFVSRSNVKRVLEKIAKAAGEMFPEDIEEGGDWYDTRIALEDVCKKAGIKCEVVIFDQYQGPYAKLPKNAKLSMSNKTKNRFYFEGLGKDEAFNAKDMVSFLKEVYKSPFSVKEGGSKDFSRIRVSPSGKKEFVKKVSTPEERKHLRLIKSALRNVLAKIQPQSVPDRHQHKICVDIVKNPAKALISPISAEEAESTLKTKFKYTQREIDALKGVVARWRFYEQ
jgi:hypothetical protein